MKACTALGNTGNPFGFEINASAGINMLRVGSAIHLENALGSTAYGGEKSNANKIEALARQVLGNIVGPYLWKGGDYNCISSE